MFYKQEELKSVLSRKKSCSDAVHFVLLKLFSIEELTTSSVMGVETKKGKRPGLNEERRGLVEGRFCFIRSYCLQK
jgi:hypothetical protein